MATAEGMVAAMASLIGVGEETTNHNFLTRWYADRMGVAYRVCPWCDIAISYAAAASGNTDATCGMHAWTVEHARAFDSAGLWNFGCDGIGVGDIVFFDWSGKHEIAKIDHVGVVEYVTASGYIGTIEGNTEDVCKRRLRSPYYIAGYGRPSYDGTSSITSALIVDGEFGPLTVKAMQRQLNDALPLSLNVDGEFGPLTKKALQCHLNLELSANLVIDGVIGKLTTHALQRHVGTAHDGIWGTLTTKALQRRLNAVSF
jgi:hypothetical protein